MQGTFDALLQTRSDVRRENSHDALRPIRWNQNSRLHRRGSFGDALQSLQLGQPSCGLETVDEAYLREAILNPSATVAAGFAPIMPTFAGRVSEEDLQSRGGLHAWSLAGIRLGRTR